MATGVDRYYESLKKNLENLPAFSARPYDEPEGDSLIFYARDEQSYAKRLNSLLTLFLSTKDDTLVGCEVKGVQRMLRLLRLAGSFGVIVRDDKLRLGILLFFALAEPPDDPSMAGFEEDVREYRDVEIDSRDLQPA